MTLDKVWEKPKMNKKEKKIFVEWDKLGGPNYYHFGVISCCIFLGHLCTAIFLSTETLSYQVIGQRGKITQPLHSRGIDWVADVPKKGVDRCPGPSFTTAKIQNILGISARGFHKNSIEPGNTFHIPPLPKSENSWLIFQSNFRRLIQRPPRRFKVLRPLAWSRLKNEISPGRPPINIHPEGANNLWWVLAHSYFHIFYFPTEFAE